MPSLTDRGLCYGINTKSITKTYNKNNTKVKSFMDIFGNDATNEVPRNVTGSGYFHRSTFWLNVKDLSSIGFSKGTMTVAINNWNETFSVRLVNKSFLWAHSYYSNLFCLHADQKDSKFEAAIPTTWRSHHRCTVQHKVSPICPLRTGNANSTKMSKKTHFSIRTVNKDVCLSVCSDLLWVTLKFD